jgi:hypothetical protein
LTSPASWTDCSSALWKTPVGKCSPSMIINTLEKCTLHRWIPVSTVPGRWQTADTYRLSRSGEMHRLWPNEFISIDWFPYMNCNSGNSWKLFYFCQCISLMSITTNLSYDHYIKGVLSNTR